MMVAAWWPAPSWKMKSERNREMYGEKGHEAFAASGWEMMMMLNDLMLKVWCVMVELGFIHWDLGKCNGYMSHKRNEDMTN